jgi:hypothetical protein
MSPDPISSEFYKGPAYALVIGISTYERGTSLPQVKDDEFPNLCCAAKDATDVAEFLKNNGFIEYNVTPLINEQATLAAIKDAFETLRKQCKRSNTPDPLVIVYFAGHGIADDEDDDRHYLVPYDARRDKLVSTALENSDCRPQARRPSANAARRLPRCLPRRRFRRECSRGVSAQFVRAGLGDGSGRYIIASCGRIRVLGMEGPHAPERHLHVAPPELLSVSTRVHRGRNRYLHALFPKLRDRVSSPPSRARRAAGAGRRDQGRHRIVLAINRHASRSVATASRNGRKTPTAARSRSERHPQVELESPQPSGSTETYVIKGETRGRRLRRLLQSLRRVPSRVAAGRRSCRWISAGSWSRLQVRVAGGREADRTKAATATPAVTESRRTGEEPGAVRDPRGGAVRPRTSQVPAPIDRRRSRHLLADIKAEIDYVDEAKALDDVAPADQRSRVRPDLASNRNGKKTMRLDAPMGDLMTRFRGAGPRPPRRWKTPSLHLSSPEMTDPTDLRLPAARRNRVDLGVLGRRGRRTIARGLHSGRRPRHRRSNTGT